MSAFIYDIITDNGPLFIVILISTVLIACHFLFGNKNISTYISSNMSVLPEPEKIVVFDLDETLGCFVELGMFWDALDKITKNTQSKLQPLNNKRFFELIDIFPEFLRPNIINILKYIIKKKKENKCDGIMIYTNNQGPKQWATMISEYFEYHIDTDIFNHIISAFKVNGKIVEMCRTSNEKSVEDLVRCTQIPENTEICFIDDQSHKLMMKSNVYYIHVKPYSYSMKYTDMAERYYTKSKASISMDKEEFSNAIDTYMKQYNYIVNEKSVEEYEVDKVIGKKIMSHLELFFNEDKKGGMMTKTEKKTKKKANQIFSRHRKK